MAASTKANHRSRVIREMRRGLDNTNHSCISSTGSHGTVSTDSSFADFDPENEAIMSTGQFNLNLSPKLPELRDTAKKYGRWNGGRQEEFVINTSALARAFPDFSQGGSSDDSFSIEVGRGAKTRQQTSNRLPRVEYSDNSNSPIVTIGDFQIVCTPPMKAQPKSSNQKDLKNIVRKESHSKRNSSLKENIPPKEESPRFMQDYISGATRNSSGEIQRTLADLQAHVTDGSENSFITDEQPATVTFPIKNSRFPSGQHRNSPLSTVHNYQKQQVTEAMVKARASQRNVSETPSRPQGNVTVNSTALNPTTTSFMLPNMPEISELVSGTFKDGTSVFNRGSKAQSRFTSHGSGRAPSKTDYDDMAGVPLQEDEHAIFLSLDLLNSRVAELEIEKADAQRIKNDLEQEIFQLKAEKKRQDRHRRSDSALGMTDSGSDQEHQDRKKFSIEKSKLEAQIMSLQSRMDEKDRLALNQELRLKDISFERNQAVKQLAEAWHSGEKLQTENGILQRENETLKQRMSQSENETQHLKLNESRLEKKLQRRDQAIRRMHKLTREIEETRTLEIATYLASKHLASKPTTEVDTPKQNSQPGMSGQTLKAVEEKSNQDRLPTPQRVDFQKEAQDQQRPQSRSQTRPVLNLQMHSDSKIEDTTNGDLSDYEMGDETTQTIHKDLNISAYDGDDNDSNFSSVLGHGEMDLLRGILAHEQDKLKERREAATNLENDTVRSTCSIQSVKLQERGDAAPNLENDTVWSTRSVKSVHSTHQDHMPEQKPSKVGLNGILKNGGLQNQDDMTGRLSVRSAGQPDKVIPTRTETQQRHHSENYVSSRRHSSPEEMTSAFILPDITMHGTISPDARRVLDSLAHHDARNCSVCSRVASFEKIEKSNTKIEKSHGFKVQKPVPVSDRMPVAGPYEDEPTMRPSVAPGLALATVMKGLEDEFAHLKMEMAKATALYNKLDPSLGMRNRRAHSTMLADLQKAMDRKADQIYALNDVLEGQKQSGQVMSDEDIEVTLQSIGLDKKEVRMKQTAHDEWHGDANENDEDSELDLPWEGIEDTTGSAGVKPKRQTWHV